MHRYARTAPSLVAGILVACTVMSPAAEQPVLDGTAWVLSSLPGQASLTGVDVTLGFAEGRVAGTDGCNRYVASYTANGESLRIEPSGAATQMACPPAVMQQAQAYMASLTAARRYAIEAGQLHLLGPDGKRLASFVTQPRDLAGSSWRVTGYNNGRQAVVSVLGGTSITLSFSADGKVSGSAGCNSYVSDYQVSGTAVTFGPAATTRRMCSEPERVMEQEQQFLSALESATSARQEGGRLELRSAAGALAISLTKEAAR